MLSEIRNRHAPNRLAALKGQNSLVIHKIAVVKKAHPFIDKSAALLEPRERSHGNDRQVIIAVLFAEAKLKFTPMLALIIRKRKIEAADRA